MKRRCFDSHTKPRSSIPTSPRREIIRGKRVKFTDIEVDNRRNFRSDSSSISFHSSRKSHDAKTSEFAFFKKLKEVSGQKFTSHSMHNEPIDQSDTIGSRNTSNLIKNTSLSDKINVVDNRCEDFGASFRVENATPVRFNSFNPPRGGFDTPKHSDSKFKKAYSTMENMQKRQKEMEGYGHASRTEEGNGEIFNRKRQKLRKWVTDTSFPEIDGHGLKGYDIVSKLLSRLIPQSNENNIVENDAKSRLTAYPESDTHHKKLQLTPSRDFTQLEFRTHLEDDILVRRSNSSTKRILYLDGMYSHDNTTNHFYKEWESDSKIQRRPLALCPESDSHFDFPLRRFRPTEPVEEVDEFFHPNRYLFSNRSNTPMLGWAFDTKNTEQNLSSTFPDIEPIDYKFYGRGLLSLPSVRITEESEIPLPLPRQSSYHDHEFGTPMLEDKEVIIPSSNDNHLALSCQKSYFTPVKESSYETSFHNQDHWLISEILRPGNHCGAQTESLISPGILLGLDWKCFPMSVVPRNRYSSSYQAFEYPTNLSLSQHSNVHNEHDTCVDGSCHKGTLAHFSGKAVDNVDIQDWSSSSFRISLD